MKKTISLILSALFTLFALAGCGKGASVSKAYVNDRNHVILEYSDGQTEDLGEITGSDAPDNKPAVANAFIDENGHIVVELSDGTQTDFGEIPPSAGSEPLSVREIRINEEMHAIAEMSDGTTRDLGYVGVEVPVEVVPPLYNVVFVDINGKTLSEQKVYKGQPAEAPKVPAVPDATFDRWDTDFSDIRSDLIIKPVYIAAATYTVTFLDDKGAVLSKQTVVSGHAASAPKVPVYEKTVFDRWDRSFANVTSDLTVTAVYRAKKTFTVIFKDYSGVTLGRSSVLEGGTAAAPVDPVREGYTFTGWSSELNNVRSDMTVTAKYSQNSGSNLFDISYRVDAGTVTVSFRISGTVRFCGLEGSVRIPTGLEFTGLTEGDGATANYKDGTVYFMFASNNGKNVTTDITLMTLNFKIASGVAFAELVVTVSDIYDQDYADVSYSVIGSVLKF